MGNKPLECYQCDRTVWELSPRSRCVECEYKRAEFNAKENDELRAELAEVKELKDLWEKNWVRGNR